MKASLSPLRSYRAANGKTLEQLATAFGVNKTTVMRWEEGRIPAERVAEVEKATGLSRSVLRPDLFASRPTDLREAVAS